MKAQKILSLFILILYFFAFNTLVSQENLPGLYTVRAWHVNKSAGFTANDYSSNSNQGQITDVTWTTQGNYSNSSFLDGDNVKINKLDGNIIITLYLTSVSDILTFNQSHVDDNRLEYQWAILIDSDGSYFTGDYEGYDVEISLRHFKPPGSSPFQGSILDGTQWNTWILTESGGSYGNIITASLDYDNKSIIMIGDKTWPELENVDQTDRFVFNTYYDSPDDREEDFTDIVRNSDTVFDTQFDVPYNFIDITQGTLLLPPTTTPAVTISSVRPCFGSNNDQVEIKNLSGYNFQSGAIAKLTRDGEADIIGTDVNVENPGKITCNFDLTGSTPGIWNMVVTNPDAQNSGTSGTSLFIITPPNVLNIFANPEPNISDRFGEAIAAVGENVLVGAYYDDTNAENAGAAYLFDRISGEVLLTFLNPSPTNNTSFGSAVTGVDNNLLIGNPSDDTGATNAGAAYLFDGTNGTLLHTFQKSIPKSNDGFGGSVASIDNKIFIGAKGDDTGAARAGAVYVFNGDQLSPDFGSLIHIIANPDPNPSEYFGYTIAAVGENILIGAPFDNSGVDDAGAAYLFNGSTWECLHTFVNPEPAEDDYFGRAVAGIGKDVLIGAPYDDLDGSNAGIVYLFDGYTGELKQTFHNPTPAENEYFGYAVAGYGDKVLIGVYKDNTDANNCGIAYLFDAESGDLVQTLSNPTPESDWFGKAVAFLDRNVLIGAPYDDTGGYRSGAVFLFDPGVDINFGGSTPAGSDVDVNFENDVSLNFENVNSEGETTVTETTTGPPPPSGFQIVPVDPPIYYNISTTAAYSGLITIQINYDEAQLNVMSEDELKLYHYDDGSFVDITIEVNTVENYIKGQTSSLSEFAIATLEDNIVPVELVSFKAEIKNETVMLTWTTASESNNYGFNIERQTEDEKWTEIGFVEGHGTISIPHTYSFTDENPPMEILFYRIKQTDFDGEFTYYEPIKVTISAPETFVLLQNYPNPFNPYTEINYQLPKKEHVSIIIYNLQGQKVRTLVEGMQVANYYSIGWDSKDSWGRELPTGIYMYRIKAGTFIESKKMLLLK